MKKSERLELLLKKGYFPEGLPPPFNSDGLADNSKALCRLWKTLKPKKSKWQKYNIPRAGGHRRFYAVTNPVSQFYLSQLIAYEWPKIKAFTNKSIFALDKISFPLDGTRAVTQTDFGSLDLRRLEISSYNDLTLNMDISRFYPTLYTHAIPWALHSKEWCKQQKFNSDKYRETLGAKLDFYVRQTQEDQTLGIPIGPDTSRVLSEIVAVAVELKFIEIIEKKKINGVRNYDDVAIGVSSLSKAEKFKFAFEQALNHFEL